MMSVRKYNNFFVLLAFLLLTAIYSCTGVPNEAVTNYNRTADELIDKVNDNSDKINSLFAEGTVTVDAPDMYNTGDIEFGIIKPDSIYIKISGPFGISIARLNINSDKFIYYNVQENYVIKGSSSAGNLGAVLQVKISYDEIMKGFTNSFKINKDEYDSVAINDLSLILEIQTFENSGKIVKYFINKEDGTMSRVVSIDGENHLEIDYSNYKKFGNILFPKNIVINNKTLKQTIYLDLSTIKLNTIFKYHEVKYPMSARLIEWN